jgi:hypothetical protein
MDLLGVSPHELEGLRSLPGLTGVELLAGQIRHLAHELGVEKASVSTLSLIRFNMKRGESGCTVTRA